MSLSICPSSSAIVLGFPKLLAARLGRRKDSAIRYLFTTAGVAEREGIGVSELLPMLEAHRADISMSTADKGKMIDNAPISDLISLLRSDDLDERFLAARALVNRRESP